MSNIIINEGTQTALSANQNGTVHIPFTKLDAGIGSARLDWNGTVPFVGNLNTGTITRLGGGSVVVTGGTVNTGTIFAKTIGTEIAPTNEFVGSATLTGTATGTLRAAVTGSQIFVTTLIVSVESAGSVSVASGTPTIPLNGTMTFAANGGIAAMPINPPLRTVSGSALVFNQSGTGVIGIWASGFIE